MRIEWGRISLTDIGAGGMSSSSSLSFLRINGDDISLSSVRSQRDSAGSIYLMPLGSKTGKKVREEEEADTPVRQDGESRRDLVNSRQDTDFWYDKFTGGFNHQERASHIPSNSEIGAESVIEIGEWDSDVNVSNASSASSMAQKSSRGSYETRKQKYLGVNSSSSSDYETHMESSSSNDLEEGQLTKPTIPEKELEKGKYEGDNVDKSSSTNEDVTLILGEKHNTLNSKPSASLQVDDLGQVAVEALSHLANEIQYPKENKVAGITPLSEQRPSSTQDVTYFERHTQLEEVPALKVTTPQIPNKSSLPGPLSSNQDVTCLDQRTQVRNSAASSSRVDDPQITKFNLEAPKREYFLCDAEFEEVFGMSKETYTTLPVWKQVLLKKQTGLF